MKIIIVSQNSIRKHFLKVNGFEISNEIGVFTLYKSPTTPDVVVFSSGSTESIMKDLESSVKPYDEKFKIFSTLPQKGYEEEEILKQIREITYLEGSRWQDGYVSGAVYHGDREHIDFLNQVYALQSQSNPLHVDLFPSASKFESEIVSMTASMLGAKKK